MSATPSPSITQFFKAQRKRPRTGKEAVVSSSKKLILEDGIISQTSGSGVVEDHPPKLKAVAAAADIVKDKKKPEEEKKKKSSKSSKTSKSSKSTSNEQKITSFVKPADSAPLETSDAGASTSTTTSQNLSSESPVKFVKIGSLSPGKRNLMSAGQIAKILKKKTKLQDLKKALEGINQCEQKLNHFRRTVAEVNNKPPVLASPSKTHIEQNAATTSSGSKGVPATLFYSPSAADQIKGDLQRLSESKGTSPSKITIMNNKARKRLFELDEKVGNSGVDEQKSKAAPAYQRLHSLAQKTSAERGKTEADVEADLILPFHFKLLKELFVACETVVGIMKSRKEVTTFPKVKAGVLELVRKVPLREKHLAQMVTVLPDCYTFELVKIGQDSHIKINVVDLLPSVVVARRRAFHSALIKVCLEHHQKFLLELVPPIRVPADKQITRWHPQFKLDEIPDIVAVENALPTKPLPSKVSSAREVIAKAQNILEHANPKMKQAIVSMVNKEESNKLQVSKAALVQTQSTAKLKALKGVSASLLEKIKKREQDKLLKEMTRSPAETKKLQMMKQLPNFIRIIRNIMVAEKKVALPMDTVIERICHSIQNMSTGDTEAHLRLLATVGLAQRNLKLTRWFNIVKLSHSEVEYVRIDKNIDINDLLEEMNDIIKKNSAL